MPFIGAKPSTVPLTSADLEDSIITSAKIVDGAIVNADINASAAIAGSKISGSFGKVLQVVTSTQTSGISTTSTSFVTTGHALTITPSATSSKIFLIGNFILQTSSNTASVDIYESTSSSFVSGGLDRGIGATEPANVMVPCAANVLASPNTTSAITYTVYYRQNAAGTASYGRGDLLSSLTAFEIGA